MRVRPASTITCPMCGTAKAETMPTDACLFFYECTGCGALLRPKPAGLSGESKAVAKLRSCATKESPRGRTWSGHPRCAEHVQQLGGASPLSILMAEKG